MALHLGLEAVSEVLGSPSTDLLRTSYRQEGGDGVEHKV